MHCLVAPLAVEFSVEKDDTVSFMFSSFCVSEATRAIVEYSESAVELLRRKKLRREFLFQYLAECGVAISVNAEKYQLIRRVLQYWGSPVPSDRELQVSLPK